MMSLSSSSVAAGVRGAVQSLEKNLPLNDLQPLASRLSFALYPARMGAALLLILGAFALVLAAVGLYGVTAYTVAQRTHELGIRMALGARQKDVMQLVLRQGMKLSLLGVALGLGAAFGLTRLLTTLLFGVPATDPLTFAGIALLLTGIALLACWMPARRATKVDPMIALRCD